MVELERPERSTTCGLPSAAVSVVEVEPERSEFVEWVTWAVAFAPSKVSLVDQVIRAVEEAMFETASEQLSLPGNVIEGPLVSA